jgi:hypothetical protein
MNSARTRAAGMKANDLEKAHAKTSAVILVKNGLDAEPNDLNPSILLQSAVELEGVAQ